MVKEISVPEEVPSGFPQNLHSESSTSTSVQLTWQMPLLAERNGIITKYTILYRDINVAYQPVELPVVPADTTMTLSGLKPDTTYDVKVRAHTSKGPGPYSPSVQFRTLPVDQGRICLLVALTFKGVRSLDISVFEGVNKTDRPIHKNRFIKHKR